MYEFSARSLGNLVGVDERLVQTAYRALALTEVDFGVIDGCRTYQEQLELFSRGATQTLSSKHLSGDAIDVAAYIGPRVSWELKLYDCIAEAFRVAAKEVGLPVRWGGAWTVPDICQYNQSMTSAQTEYIDSCRAEGRRPFIDAGHFEVND